MKTTVPWYKKSPYRSESDRIVCGLLGGLAKFFGVNSALLRLGFVIVTAFSGFMPGIVIYILGWIIVPKEK